MTFGVPTPEYTAARVGPQPYDRPVAVVPPLHYGLHVIDHLSAGTLGYSDLPLCIPATHGSAFGSQPPGPLSPLVVSVEDAKSVPLEILLNNP